VLLRESLGQPLLLLIEDLHWLDSETDAWLQGLSERIATARVLLLLNYRPEYQHAWGSKSYYTQLRLDPLGPKEAQELLTALLGERPDLAPLKQLILARTEGNPFFMEEIVQALVEQGVLLRQPAGGVTLASPTLAGSLTTLQLPATVQGLLAARIDRLPADQKALLQTLAVIGKEFALGLLRQVVAQPEGELQGQLSRLQAAEFLYERPAFPEPEYTFKHALTQEVAYNSLLVERRRALHERTGQALETLFGERLEERYPELAYHYSHSSNTAKAIVYLERAGQQALQRSAYADAIQQLTTVLGLLTAQPETPERAGQELAIQTALGLASIATRSYGALEVAQAYRRARELCQQLGETPQLFPVLWGLERHYLVRAEHATAGELAEQLLSLAQQQGEPALLLEAHRAVGQSLCWRGRVAEARGHLEQAIALYHPQQHRSHAVRYGRDPGVDCRGYAAIALWWLGYPEQGLAHLQEALPLAQALSHPFSLAMALVEAAVVHQLRRETEATLAQAEAAIAVSSEQGFPMWLAYGTVFRGWALAVQGQDDKGIAQIRQGLDALRAIGAEFLRPYCLAMLAEAYARSGQTEAGLAAVAEALAAVEATGERFWEAELHRLQGECLLAQDGKGQTAEEAETCFRQALEIARRQGAKAYELRAALSLSRLWQRQGRREDARQLLEPIYGWFTEGFDTADLQAAKALIDVLA